MFEVCLLCSAAILLSPDAHRDQIQQPQPAGPTCQAIPEDAPQDVQDCAEGACDTYTEKYNNCDTPECRAAASLQYAYEVGQCWQELQMDETWAVFWYSGDSFGVNFNNQIPSDAVVFLF